MGFVSRAERLLKHAVLWAWLAVVALFLVMAGLGFLAAALFIWMTTHLGAAAAAAITGAALLGLALLTTLIGGLVFRRLRRRAPHLFGNAFSLISTLASLGGLLVRRDPKRAVLMALVAGALAEYFTVPDKPRG